MADPSKTAPIKVSIPVPSSTPDLYMRSNTFQRNMNIKCLDFLQMTFDYKPSETQQFLDVGCGTGDFTREELLPRCQPCHRIVATEMIHEMIEYAKKKFPHPQIEYEEHDIRSDVSGLLSKYGEFDRVYSLFALHWVQDLADVLKSIASLMKDDGDCVFVFPARTVVSKIWRRFVQLDRWKKYDEPSRRFIAKTQYMEDSAALMSYMLDTLKSVNLRPLTCEVLTTVQSEEGSDRTIGIRGAVIPLLRQLPEDTRKEFMEDLEKVIHEFWTEKHPADPQYHVNTFVVHARKI